MSVMIDSLEEREETDNGIADELIRVINSRVLLNGSAEAQSINDPPLCLLFALETCYSIKPEIPSRHFA